jgi:FkbM family methyltransferase
MRKIRDSFLNKFIYKVVNTYILKLFGLKLSRNIGDDFVDVMKWLLGEYEVGHIIDGGAYRGDFSLQMAAAFPFATIYAFEPQKKSYALLCNVTREIPRIKTYNCALSSHSGKSVLHTNISPLTSSLSNTSEDGLHYFQDYLQPEGSEQVEVTSLSDFLSNEKVPGVDILKLDLQGHELQTIKGMDGFVGSVKLIFVEVQFLEIYQGTPLFSEVETYLRTKGFVFYQFFGLVRSPIDGRLLSGDAIFFNRKHVSLSKS